MFGLKAVTTMEESTQPINTDQEDGQMKNIISTELKTETEFVLNVGTTMEESTKSQYIARYTDVEEQPERNDLTEHSVETEECYSDELFEMYCESCNREGSHVLATSFCSTCVDFLCPTCLRYHKKFLPDHQYLDGDKMSNNVFYGECQYHKKEILKFLCVSCNKVACSTCKIKDHKQPDQSDHCDLKYLPDVVKGFEIKSEIETLLAKSATFCETLSQSETKMHDHLKKINDIHNQGEVIVKKETEAIFQPYVTEIQGLEEKILSEKNVYDSKIDSIVSQYEQIKSEINKLKTASEKLTVLHSKQLYMLIIEVNNVKRDLESAEKSLQSSSFNSNDLEADVQTKVNKMTERVTYFAPILTTVLKMDIEKIEEKVTRKKAHQIKEINVEHHTDDQDCHIIDCCLLSPNYLVICDENNRCLKLVDVEEDEVVSIRSLRTSPAAITKINSSEIAVAQLDDFDNDRSIIAFLTVTEANSFYFQKGHIKTDLYCEDMIYINDILIIALSENNKSKIQILDMDGDVLETVLSDDGEEEALFSSPVCLAVGSFHYDIGCMYVADSYKGRLTEIDIDFSEYDNSDEDERSSDSESSAATVGRSIAKFSRPNKITTDESGYLYVVDSGTRCIHSIHPSRENSEVILVTDIDDDWQPESLCYCCTNDLLYVGQCHQNSIRVFQVKEATFKKHITLENVIKWQEVS